MENRKYVVCRDDIYVGEVVRTSKIYRYEGDSNFFRTKPGQLDTGTWRRFRSMLFVPNEDKLANDLLYKSPNYPILNITNDETCLNIGEKSVVVKDSCNLAALLEYFNYKKYLTYEDIMKIRKTFFTGRFAMDNCELFGYKENKPEDWTYYKGAVEITDPRELKKYIARARRAQQMGHRSFVSISESVLPTEYFDVLNDRGNNSLMDVIKGWDEKMNAFAPHKLEGPVRKLTRF